jgi:hypothetical protein
MDMVLWMQGRYDYFKNTPLALEGALGESLRLDPTLSRDAQGRRVTHFETALQLWTRPGPASVEEAFQAALERIAPNPVTASAEIDVLLQTPSDISLAVYSVSGRLVRRLAGGSTPAGRRTFSWDCRDETGSRVASGIYFVRLSAAGRSHVRRVAVIR